MNSWKYQIYLELPIELLSDLLNTTRGNIIFSHRYQYLQTYYIFFFIDSSWVLEQLSVVHLIKYNEFFILFIIHFLYILLRHERLRNICSSFHLQWDRDNPISKELYQCTIELSLHWYLYRNKIKPDKQYTIFFCYWTNRIIYLVISLCQTRRLNFFSLLYRMN